MAVRGEDEDVWGVIMYDASWGGIRLDVVETDDSGGRATARHRFVHRDGAQVEDLGGVERVTRCTVVFFERGLQPGEVGVFDDKGQAVPGLSHFDRFKRLHDAVAEGKPRTFVHPITGSYRAKVGDFAWRAAAEPRDSIVCTVEFVEDTTEPAAVAQGGSPDLAGAAQVDVAATAVDVEVATTFDDEDAPVFHLSNKRAIQADFAKTTDLSRSSAAAWEDPASSKALRDVNNDLLAASKGIDGLVDRYELATDPARLPLYNALSGLRYSLTKAARSFAERGPLLTTINVLADAPLLVIAAKFYQSAAGAEGRAQELLRLNVVKNPARVPAGTVLKAQSPLQRAR